MATLPIYLEVEDVALGPVLIKLRSMPGIIKLHLNLLEGPNPAATPRPRGNIQESVLAFMMKHSEQPMKANEIAKGSGVTGTSIYGALSNLKKRGAIRQAGIGGRQWELTPQTRREMGHIMEGAAPEAVKLLPKPRAQANGHHGKSSKSGKRAPQGSGWLALRAALDAGPMKRSDIITHLDGRGVSANSITGVLDRAATQKFISGDGKGTWQLTAKGKQQPLEATAEEQA